MWGQRVLNGIFRARALISILVLGLVILDIAFFLLSFGPFTFGSWISPVPLSTLQSIEAAVAIGGLSLAYATMVLAESSERQRRFASSPRLTLRASSLWGAEGRDLRLGEPFLSVGTPALLVANEGNGPAFGVSYGLWWKSVEYVKSKSADQSSLEGLPWTKVPVPEGLPAVIRRSDPPVTIGLAHLNQADAKGQLTVKPVASYLLVRYLNPDGEVGPPLAGGVKLVGGSVGRRPGVAGEVDTEQWTPLTRNERPEGT